MRRAPPNIPIQATTMLTVTATGSADTPTFLFQPKA